MEAKECSNLVKEFNGEKNWCLLKDTHCPLLVKHERYNFDKQDVKCDYLNSLNGVDSKNGIAKEITLSSKECNGCKQIFKTDNLRLRYCSDLCRNSAKRKSEKDSRLRKSLVK